MTTQLKQMKGEEIRISFKKPIIKFLRDDKERLLAEIQKKDE